MIIEAKNKKPYIHFGFNQFEKTIYEGETATIWQDVTFSESINTNRLDGKNNNKLQTNQTEEGVYYIKVLNKEIESNELILKIIKR